MTEHNSSKKKTIYNSFDSNQLTKTIEKLQSVQLSFADKIFVFKIKYYLLLIVSFQIK